jgi:hypothetical protein
MHLSDALVKLQVFAVSAGMPARCRDDVALIKEVGRCVITDKKVLLFVLTVGAMAKAGLSEDDIVEYVMENPVIRRGKEWHYDPNGKPIGKYHQVPISVIKRQVTDSIIYCRELEEKNQTVRDILANINTLSERELTMKETTKESVAKVESYKNAMIERFESTRAFKAVEYAHKMNEEADLLLEGDWAKLSPDMQQKAFKRHFGNKEDALQYAEEIHRAELKEGAQLTDEQHKAAIQNKVKSFKMKDGTEVYYVRTKGFFGKLINYAKCYGKKALATLIRLAGVVGALAELMISAVWNAIKWTYDKATGVFKKEEPAPAAA